MKNQKKINPLSLEDVPGIGPVAIKLLKKEGYDSTLALICKTPTFLKEITNMDKEKAGQAFRFMKKNLAQSGHISKQEQSATELYFERKKIKRVSIGCRAIDRLLNGGIESGSITEFYGENGSGKTQISHTLAIQVQRPIKEGGLLEEKGKPPIILYIDTENTCRPERFISILAGKKLIVDIPGILKQKILDEKELTPQEALTFRTITKKQEQQAKPYLDHIEIQKSSNAFDLFLKVQTAIQTCLHVHVKLIIVDSATSLFRSEFLGRGNIKPKFDLLNEMIHDLKLIAEHYKIPVVFINQIYHAPEQSYGKDEDIPYGGNIVGHAIPYRIKLEKFIKTHKATIMKSPYQSNDEAKFKITEAGLSDID